MKFYTHRQKPKSKPTKGVIFLIVFCAILIYTLFFAVSFVFLFCIKSPPMALTFILLPTIPTAIFLLYRNDINRAYVEIIGNDILVVDYCFGIKKEMHFLRSQITSAEICLASSLKIKGRRAYGPIEYILFRNNGTYLFKLINLPETSQLFREYIS